MDKTFWLQVAVITLAIYTAVTLAGLTSGKLLNNDTTIDSP